VRVWDSAPRASMLRQRGAVRRALFGAAECVME
jgi:hypothetical protein